MSEVTLKMSFKEILGANSSEFPESVRRARWASWLRLSRQTEQRIYKFWIDTEDCLGCIHKRGRWCRLSELPCTVNPYVSFRSGNPGMACMGAGKETLAA